MTWTAIWFSWLAFLIVADIIANRKHGATLSEHCQVWFSSIEGRMVLAMFFISLFFHFAFKVSVIPVLATAVGVVIMIARELRSRKNHERN